MQAAKKSGQLWNHLSAHYTAMQKLFRYHPSGPLDIVLHALEDGEYSYFDPYHQGNVPQVLYYIADHGKMMHNVRLPCPTHQEFIHKADLIPEFKGFLRNNAEQGHLLINFQDRTSWREQARASTIEGLCEVEEFCDRLYVATLAKDTEFYHQLAPYHEEHQAHRFIAHLKEHLSDELSGFYFLKA